MQAEEPLQPIIDEQPVYTTGLTITQISEQIRHNLLCQYRDIGADTVVVYIPETTNPDSQISDFSLVEYSADIGAGANPYLREEGSVTLDKRQIRFNKKQYFGRQIFTYRPTEEIGNKLPIYVNPDMSELQPGDFFAAGPAEEGTSILQLEPKFETRTLRRIKRTQRYDDGTESTEIIDEIYDNSDQTTNSKATKEPQTITEVELECIEITSITGIRVRTVSSIKISEYEEPEDYTYNKNDIFVPPPHLKKHRSDLAKVRIKAE